MSNEHLCLAELRAVDTSMPKFSGYEVLSEEELAWLGRAYAAVHQWSSFESAGVKTATDWLGMPGMIEQNLNKIRACIKRGIADLELKIRLTPTSTQQVYGPGAVYDFFNDLARIIRSSTRDILIADPYMDAEIFDLYLTECSSATSVRLLAKNSAPNLKAAAAKFCSQKNISIQIRQSTSFHDRVILHDGTTVWVIGQSLKDAAKSKVTYLAPLSSDVANLKIDFYEQVWQAGKAI